MCSIYDNVATTANGEPFHEYSLTAAHRTLPFNSRVKVTYKKRSIVVRINDRGPFIKGRILDLTPSAAERLGLDDEGLGNCEIQVLRPGSDGYGDEVLMCKKDWDNSCKKNEDCCSGICGRDKDVVNGKLCYSRPRSA